MGRPKKPPGERVDPKATIKVYLTAADRLTVDLALGYLGEDASSWARGVLVAAARRVTRRAEKSDIALHMGGGA